MPAKYIAALLLILSMTNCTPLYKVNKYLDKGYCFIQNNDDTLFFNTLMLDDAYDHVFEINKQKRTIHLQTNEDQNYLILNKEQIFNWFLKDNIKVGLIVNKGIVLMGTNSENNDILIQQSLLTHTIRISADSLAKSNVFLHHLNGDIILIN